MLVISRLRHLSKALKAFSYDGIGAYLNLFWSDLKKELSSILGSHALEFKLAKTEFSKDFGRYYLKSKDGDWKMILKYSLLTACNDLPTLDLVLIKDDKKEEFTSTVDFTNMSDISSGTVKILDYAIQELRRKP